MRAKVPGKWVKVEQGPTTAVFHFMGFAVLKTEVLHREPKPVLFRKSRRIEHVEM